MLFGPARDLPEASAEFSVELIGTVSDDIQTAALFRSGRAKCGYDDVPPWLQAASYRGDVPLARFRIDQEVEDGPVVPVGIVAG